MFVFLLVVFIELLFINVLILSFKILVLKHNHCITLSTVQKQLKLNYLKLKF